MKPRPFLKWAGGKTQLLPELLKRIPATWNPAEHFYCEPFLGAGALFWELAPSCAALNDLNEELYIAWLGVSSASFFDDMLAELFDLREAYAIEPEGTYYRMRDAEPAASDIAARAARTIFLNKTCFNGLYRVNASGKFNVPWGQNPNAQFCDEENLAACSMFIREHGDVLLYRGDFGDILPCVTPGSLVYCDPPYVPVGKTSNFDKYNAGGFSYADQLRLVVWAAHLRDKGAHVILSQAADENLIDQYRRVGFKCDLVAAKRNINSKGDARAAVGEYIIY
jgi:DNA adenine methylase